MNDPEGKLNTSARTTYIITQRLDSIRIPLLQINKLNDIHYSPQVRIPTTDRTELNKVEGIGLMIGKPDCSKQQNHILVILLIIYKPNSQYPNL